MNRYSRRRQAKDIARVLSNVADARFERFVETEGCMDYIDHIESYDIDVQMGISPERALAYVFKNHRVSRQIIEHHLREIGDASVRQAHFEKAVTGFVASWTTHAEQYEIVSSTANRFGDNGSYTLDHEIVSDDLMFSFTRLFPKHMLFQLRDGISQVIEVLMQVNIHMFVAEDQS